MGSVMSSLPFSTLSLGFFSCKKKRGGCKNKMYVAVVSIGLKPGMDPVFGTETGLVLSILVYYVQRGSGTTQQNGNVLPSPPQVHEVGHGKRGHSPTTQSLISVQSQKVEFTFSTSIPYRHQSFPLEAEA